MDIDLETIFQTFLAESEERLDEMEEALVALEADPLDDKFLQAIFRDAHTLKGNSASLGFSKVAEFTHAFEDLLQRFRNHTAPVTQGWISVLLRSVDALREMIPDAIAGSDELRREHAALLHVLLQQMASGNSPEAKADPARDAADANRRTKPFGRRREDIQAWMERAGSIRVDTYKLDRMLNLVGEMTIAQGRLRQVLQNQLERGTEALEVQSQVERLSLFLQEQIMKVRMVPVGPIFRQFKRTVRDLAQSTAKSARLVLEGEDVEIDMSVVEHLKDPLTHMIRNALDHGVESPEARKAGGKDPCGLITLKASHDGGGIAIQITDDGAGLNRDRIAERARSLGIISDPDGLSEHDFYQLIFEPGFSTAEKITDLSGRGVGMDVVRRNIEALRGSVAVDSRPGKGTCITMRLPLTLAIIDGFGVGVGNETYVLPLYTVIECLPLPAEEQKQQNSIGVINLRGEPLPYVRLRDRFELLGPRPQRENIVVVKTDRSKAGIAVDVLYGPRQTVIKPLNKAFCGLAGIAGSAILENGRVALIVDVPGLLRDVMQAQGIAMTVAGNHHGLEQAN